MTKSLASFALVFILALSFAPVADVYAQATTGCSPACGTGTTCYLVGTTRGCLSATQIVRLTAAPTVTTPGSGAVTAPGATAQPATDGTLKNPLKVDSLTGLLDIVLSAAIEIGSIILVLMIIWVGFMFVTARGNAESIAKARTALIWTVIGGLILLGAKGIESVIASTVSNL